MHRAYLTPVRLKKMDQSLSAHCWYGCGEEGTLLHMLWHCPVIESLWREVALFLSGILKVDLQLSPKTCLLGARVENIQSNKHQRVVALGLHEDTEGFEETYIHRRSVVNSARCLEHPTDLVPLKTVLKN